MKRKVTFGEFFSTLGMGLWQAVCWVCKVFNPKYKTAFWRVIWGIFAVCLLTLTSISTYEKILSHCEKVEDDDDEYTENLSENVYIVKDSYFGEPKYICNKKTGKTIKEIDWFLFPENNDELAVYCQKDLCGYYNWKKGEVAITPKYSKAWAFSERLAAVCQGDTLFFIDKQGNEYYKNLGLYYSSVSSVSDYVFHGNLCIVYNKDLKCGLLNIDGSWAVDLVYDYIEWNDKTNLWIAANDGKYSLIDNSGNVVFGGDCCYLEAVDKDNIYVAYQEGVFCRYNLEGELLDTGIISYAEHLEYVVDELEKTVYEDNSVSYENRQDIATCLVYSFNYDKKGLMTKSGKIVTPAIYTSICAIGKDLYLCDLDEDHCVLLNSNGEKVN